MKTNILTSIFLIIALTALALQFAHEPWPPLRIAGAIIAFASLVLILIARIQLGRAFSIRAKATRLVTTGLYARLRNPIYVFGCFFFLGIAMFIPFWWLLLTLLIVIPMQIARARREAAILEATFGEEYRRYRRQTWF
jgi:protein-S-isoprenylcysteine O-methyltransferase Ste14